MTEKSPEWLEKRIKWFEQTLKDLRSGKTILMHYHFGYCPSCNDITEITLESDNDCGWPTRFSATCQKCGLCTSSRRQNPIRYIGNEIPPEFKKKWDRMNGRPNQIKVHKQKIREFLASLEKGIEEQKGIHQEALKRLGKYANMLE